MDFLNALVAFTNFVLVPGTAYGAQLALGALGVTLIYGILRFSNFAHGDTMAFGTMFVILFTWGLQAAPYLILWGTSISLFGGLGLFVPFALLIYAERFPMWSLVVPAALVFFGLIGGGVVLMGLPTALLALPFGIAACGLFLLATDKVVYKFYRRQRVKPVVFVMVSLGVMFIMNGLVRFVIGPQDIRFADGERFIITARNFKEISGLNEGLAIKTTQGITLVTAVIVVALLFWFLNKTRTGKSMRAYSDNEDLALLSGINPERVVLVTWLIVAALATVAGTLYGLDKSFKAFTYFQLLLPIFASAIVGGLGNPLGAIAGGFLIAFSEVTVTYAFKKVTTYVLPEAWAPDGLVQLMSTDYKLAVSFSILIIVLLFKPTGLFKGQSV